MYETVTNNTTAGIGYSSYTTNVNKKADHNGQGQNNDQGIKGAVFVKISEKNAYPPIDPAQVQKALDETQKQKEAFIDMLRKMYLNQGKNASAAGFSLINGKLPDQNLADFISGLKPDQATIDKAKEAISEDGYYGVKQTSERILSFAKAIAGDDPAKIDEMRAAVEAGFKAAGDVWGKELPGICRDTYDAVMKGFDSWKESAVKVAAVA